MNISVAIDGVVITPNMIETGPNHWFNGFNHTETEVSAKLFVRACQKAEQWKTTKGMLDAEDSGGRYCFNELMGEFFTYRRDTRSLNPDQGWIIEENGFYYPTAKFIEHVFKRFPKKA
jgi:hypothetical protein